MNTEVGLSPLEETVFYALDKAIKSYRQFAQRNIKENQLDITIDQWLVLKTIQDHPKLTQREISDIVFKDYASVTRIIELLVRSKYLKRSFHNGDRRRYKLQLTKSGEQLYDRLVPVIYANRKRALTGISGEELRSLHAILQKMTSNCFHHKELSL